MPAKVNEYWEFISAARCYEIFEHEIAPRCSGFSVVRNGVLAKPISPDISHVLQLMRYKGGEYGFRWGALLTYLPSQWKNRLSWHRSPKSLTFDLWEQANQDIDNPAVLPPDERALYATFMHGEHRFTLDLRHAWTILGAYVFDWLSQLTDLQGVLNVSERQSKRQWMITNHFPPPALVHAFALARMGDLEPALDELQALTADEDLDPHGNLLRALKKIAGSAG